MKRYFKLFKEGMIEIITPQQIDLALGRIKPSSGKNRAARSLIIALYYMGARPNEVLRLVPKDFSKEGSYYVIKVPGSKGGYRRPLYFPATTPHIPELYKYATEGVALPDALLFPHFISKRLRVVEDRGVIKTRREYADKLPYYFRKWFAGILPEELQTPYVFRHNCFSKMASKGATLEQIRQAKGGRTISSVMPYVHLIKEDAKKIGKFMR